MSYIDLLERIKGNDTEAFLEMTDRYGWPVYSAICQKYSDPVLADRVYNETMNAFYHSISSSSSEDPLEDILCAFANRISPEKLVFELPISSREITPPDIQLNRNQLSDSYSVKKVHIGDRFMQCIGFLIVLAFFAVTLWLILGLLMIMEIIPYVNFGYNWFFGNIVRFFR